MQQGSSSDGAALPPELTHLLKQVSLECARVDGWAEHKGDIQQRIKQDHAATAGALASSSSSSSAAAGAASSAAGASSSFSSASLVVDADSDSLPPASGGGGSGGGAGPLSLLRHLSDAAALGVISHSTKSDIKRMLMIGSLVPMRQLSQVTLPVQTAAAAGEGEAPADLTEEQRRLAAVDADACASMQEEEREALEAIYEELVQFGTSLEETDPEAEDAASQQENDEEEEDDEEGEDEGEEEDSGATEENAADASDSSSSSPTASAATAAAASLRPAVRARSAPVLCRTVDLDVRPYPASGASRNPVSAVVRFALPPLYPFVRPSFRLLQVKGELLASDALMIVTAVNEQINRRYDAAEPLAEEDARVCIFDLLVPAQDFLVEYVNYLEDAAYHRQLALEAAAREKVRAAKAQADAAMMAHAAAFMAFSSSDHKTIEWSHASQLVAELAEKNDGIKVAEVLPDINAAFESLLPSPDALMGHIAKTDASFTRNYLPSLEAGSLYAESIISSFLVYRFMQRRKEMMHRRGAAAGAVSIGFHGTIPQYVRSIQSHGLAKPGSNLGSGAGSVSQRCGARFGSGIYLSPYASYSLNYGSFDSLFVCLVLRGRTRGAEGQNTISSDACDSYFDPSGNEWIVFDNASVLPVYLIRGKPMQAPYSAPVTSFSSGSSSSSGKARKTKKGKKGANKPQRR